VSCIDCRNKPTGRPLAASLCVVLWRIGGRRDALVDNFRRLVDTLLTRKINLADAVSSPCARFAQAVKISLSLKAEPESLATSTGRRTEGNFSSFASERDCCRQNGYRVEGNFDSLGSLSNQRRGRSQIDGWQREHEVGVEPDFGSRDSARSRTHTGRAIGSAVQRGRAGPLHLIRGGALTYFFGLRLRNVSRATRFRRDRRPRPANRRGRPRPCSASRS
jgi:hypothetical protein